MQTAFSGAELAPLVRDIGFAILVAGILAVLFAKLKIPNIAAFILAGLILGPVGAQIVTDPENIRIISELGLILLLFMIGLELDFRKILASGKTILITGALQFPLCIAFGMGVAMLLVTLGVGGDALLPDPDSDTPNYIPLYVGFLAAASSTLIVVKLLEENNQMETLAGRIALALLIIEDIWAIIIIALQPNFNDPHISPIIFSLVGIAVLAVIATLIARYILPIGFRWIAKTPSLILMAAVSWCFLSVFLGLNFDTITEAILGINLHMNVGTSMGALIAGASIASLPYSADVISRVGIVKDFLVTLFFVSLGMSIPVPDGPGVLILAICFGFTVIAARYLFVLPLLYFTGLDRRNAMVASTQLAQISDLTLVVAYSALLLGHISPEMNTAIVLSFVFTGLLAPTLYRNAYRIYEKSTPVLDWLGFKAPASEGEEEEESYSIALLGFHRLASSLLYELKHIDPDLPRSILVVDFNVAIHPRIASFGPTVRYGDLNNPETLHHTGVDRAHIIISTIPDDVLVGTTNRAIVEEVRKMNPQALIIANALSHRESQQIYEAGADYVFIAHANSARGLLPALTAALEGDLDKYRTEREETDGLWHERDEVLA